MGSSSVSTDIPNAIDTHVHALNANLDLTPRIGKNVESPTPSFVSYLSVCLSVCLDAVHIRRVIGPAWRVSVEIR